MGQSPEVKILTVSPNKLNVIKTSKIPLGAQPRDKVLGLGKSIPLGDHPRDKVLGLGKPYTTSPHDLKSFLGSKSYSIFSI